MATNGSTHTFEHQLMKRLRTVFGGKDWIVGGDVAQGVAGVALELKGLGADRILCIASRTGVGELTDELQFLFTDDSQAAEDANMVERMHDNNRELHDLPRWVLDAVDKWDPSRSAEVVVSFTIDGGLVAERPTFGAREPEWVTLEDKIAVRELWSAAGVETAPDRVVTLENVGQAVAAHRQLATTRGTVWAVDNDRGWHGGGTGTHWVSSEARARDLERELAEHHRQVRVQPFLEGVPCSIHGMVLRDETLAFRPCEMIVLLDEQNHKFVYSRAATFWDPSDEDRLAMRQTTRRVGDALRSSVGFRGVFTLDGVQTADGFRPTEVNPRFGAALPRELPLTEGGVLPMFMLHLAAGTGHLDDLDSAILERTVVDLLDRNRVGRAFIFTPTGPRDGGQTVAIDTALNVVSGDETGVLATAVWGSDPNGGLIILTFTDLMPVGPPVAPTVADIRTVLDHHWNLGLPDPELVRPQGT